MASSSLEALRRQVSESEEATADQPAEAPEEAVELEEQEEPAAEAEEESEGDEEGAEEASEEFELEVDGEQTSSRQNHDPVKVLEHKLSRERKKKREAKSEADELKERIALLEQQLQGGGQQQAQPQQQAPQQGTGASEPVFPDLYDDGINGDRQRYDAAVKSYFSRMQQYQARQTDAVQADEQHRERVQNMTKQLAGRAAKFATDNKVSVDVVANALDKATSSLDEATGIDGATAWLLDSVGDGSERVAYYIGTNDEAMTKVKELLKEDPQGFKAVTHMTRLAERLKPKNARKVSKAPEPDKPVQGDSAKSSAGAKKVQAMWDKAKTTDEMMAARKRARELGVKLST